MSKKSSYVELNYFFFVLFCPFGFTGIGFFSLNCSIISLSGMFSYLLKVSDFFIPCVLITNVSFIPFDNEDGIFVLLPVLEVINSYLGLTNSSILFLLVLFTTFTLYIKPIFFRNNTRCFIAIYHSNYINSFFLKKKYNNWVLDRPYILLTVD